MRNYLARVLQTSSWTAFLLGYEALLRVLGNASASSVIPRVPSEQALPAPAPGCIPWALVPGLPAGALSPLEETRQAFRSRPKRGRSSVGGSLGKDPS